MLIINQEKTEFILFGNGCSAYVSSLGCDDGSASIYLFAPGDADGSIYGTYKDLEQAKEVVQDIVCKLEEGRDKYIMPPEATVDEYKSGTWDDEISIDELELSVRSYNILRHAGISTVKELAGMDEESLMKLKCMGRRSLCEIENALEKAKQKYNL